MAKMVKKLKKRKLRKPGRTSVEEQQNVKPPQQGMLDMMQAVYPSGKLGKR